MRQKRDAVLSFEWSGEAALKIVRDRRKGGYGRKFSIREIQRGVGLVTYMSVYRWLGPLALERAAAFRTTTPSPMAAERIRTFLLRIGLHPPLRGDESTVPGRR